MPGTLPRIVPFGTWTAGDHCYPLVWNAETGWLDLGGDHIARIKSEERVNNCLLGWMDHLGPNSILWLTARLDRYR